MLIKGIFRFSAEISQRTPSNTLASIFADCLSVRVGAFRLNRDLKLLEEKKIEECLSHLSWVLTGKTLPYTCFVRNIQKNIDKVICGVSNEVISTSLPNTLLFSKLSKHEFELRLDSYYRRDKEGFIHLNINGEFTFDEIFEGRSYVFTKREGCIIKYPEPEKYKNIKGFVPPVVVFDEKIIFGSVSEECVKYIHEDFKILLIFRPLRKLWETNSNYN